MIRCPACGRAPSERSYRTEDCRDPLHDLADQLVEELRDYCVEHGIAWTPDSVLGAVQLYDEQKKKERVR